MQSPLSTTRLPHQPPMRWVQAAARPGEDEVVAEALLPSECGTNGEAPILLGIEVLAQAAGALLEASLRPIQTPAEGKLLQVMTARWSADYLPLATVIQVIVRRTAGSVIGLHHFSGTLLLPSGDVLLEAEFSLLVPAA